MNEPQVEKALQNLKTEVRAQLAGWEFGPDLQARVMARIGTGAAGAPRRSGRIQSWKPLLSIATAAAAVAAVALVSKGTFFDGTMQKLARESAGAQPQAAAPAPARAEPDAAHRSMAAPQAPATGAAPSAPTGAPAAPAPAAAAPAPAAGPVAEASAAAAAPAQPPMIMKAMDAAPAGAGGGSEEGGAPAARAAQPAPQPAEAPMLVAGQPEAATQGTMSLTAAPPALPLSLSIISSADPVRAGAPVTAAVQLKATAPVAGPIQVTATVLREGEVVAGLTPLTLDGLEPNEAWTGKFSWDQRQAGGTPAPPGSYELRIEVSTAAGRLAGGNTFRLTR